MEKLTLSKTGEMPKIIISGILFMEAPILFDDFVIDMENNSATLIES